MVYFFKSLADPTYIIYMGRDKEENELLIRYAFLDCDVWFHVDDHSSAHVYLRLKQGQSLDDIPPKVLMECGQLVKANSIKGNKLDDITVIYTLAVNLRKENHMVAGEVGFHDEKEVRKLKVPTRNGPLLRQLEKTKEERNPDLRREREDHDAELKRKADHEKKERTRAEHQSKKELKAKAIEEANKREYRDLFASDEGKVTNKDLSNMTAAQLEEDFW